MAALNYYYGVKRGDGFKLGAVVVGQSSNGASSDIELRAQIDNGSTTTGLKRMDVILALKTLLAYIEGGGFPPPTGTDLPPAT